MQFTALAAGVALLNQTASATMHVPELISMETKSALHLQHLSYVEEVVGLIKAIKESCTEIGEDVCISLNHLCVPIP